MLIDKGIVSITKGWDGQIVRWGLRKSGQHRLLSLEYTIIRTHTSLP